MTIPEEEKGRQNSSAQVENPTETRKQPRQKKVKTRKTKFK
jgi:hypothetical protein